MKKYLILPILLALMPVANGATVTITKTLSDLEYLWDEVRFESNGLSWPTAQARLTDNLAGFSGFDESLYGSLTRVDASFQYQVGTRYFARIDDGFGVVSADVTMGERIFIRRSGAILINQVVNTTLVSPTCSADAGTGCLEIIEEIAGPAVSYNFSFTGNDADFFLETVFVGTLFDLALDNVSSTASEPWRVAGGTKPEINNPLLDAEFSLTYTFDEIAVPLPGAIYLFGTALIGLVGLSKRRKAA